MSLICVFAICAAVSISFHRFLVRNIEVEVITHEEMNEILARHLRSNPPQPRGARSRRTGSGARSRERTG